MGDIKAGPFVQAMAEVGMPSLIQRCALPEVQLLSPRASQGFNRDLVISVVELQHCLLDLLIARQSPASPVKTPGRAG